MKNHLYLKCHVLLLTDVFEKIRKNILKNYRLFQSHYLSAPALSWDVIFDMRNFEFEMYFFFEKRKNFYMVMQCLNFFE